MAKAEPKRALVTGASGHIGANLVRSLLDQGWDVRALVRSDRRAIAGLEVEETPGDVTDRDSLAAACDGVDVVFHAAGVVSIAGDRRGLLHRVNVEGTRSMLEAAVEAKVERVVHFSSVHTLRSPERGEVGDEEHPLREDGSAYDRSKTEAERLALAASNLDVVVVSPSGVIGPHDYKPSPMGRFFRALFKGYIPATISGGYDFVDVRDVAAGAIAAAERGQAGRRYILGGAFSSIADMSRLAALASQRRKPLFKAPVWAAKAVAPAVEMTMRRVGIDPLFTRESLAIVESRERFSHERAREELDYAPRALRDTISDTWSWWEPRLR